MKKCLKIFTCIIFIISCLMLLVPNKASAISSVGGYTIQSYDIEMIVNDNNTFDITETIKVNFSSARHGIFRKIPLKNEVTRTDGTISKNRAKITNISVNNEYSLSKEDGYQVIKIGSASSTVTGLQTYIIKYNYNLGKDPLKDADELYFNLIGEDWDTTIDTVSFKITMPKEFDESLLGFSTGKKGTVGTDKVYYHVNENIITGNIYSKLNSKEAVTMRLTLPEGYFANAKSNISPAVYVMIIVPIIFLVITFILWYKYGKDDAVIETVEFYPPEGYNSAELGFLYKGKVEDKDVVSLLIYLANKGYLQISETEEKGLFSSSKGFRITKLKDYDGNNQAERKFFYGLFSHGKGVYINYSIVNEIIKNAKEQGEKISYKDAVELAMATGNNEEKVQSVTAEDLRDRFYITLNDVKSKINSKENKNKIFEKSTTGKSILVIIMVIISFLLVVGIPIASATDISEAIPSVVMLIFFTPFIAVLFGKNIPIFFRIMWGVILLPMFLGTLGATGIFEAITSDIMYLVGAIVGVICIIAMFILYSLMPKRTPYGNEILGKIRGFKRFLETAEKDKLEAMVMENPTYFYDILPYTYVLGISDKWIKQFETIAIQEPNWYSSSTAFSVATFGSFMNSTMSSASTAMTSSPSSSSDGGGGFSSGGGGSSGGGSGGGGGGSW